MQRTTSPSGIAKMEPFTGQLFYGALCFFLLDMGIVAAQRLADLKQAGAFLIGFSLLTPLANASVGLGLASVLHLSHDDGDIIKMYNDRGAVLGIARVTETMRPGVIHSYASSSKYDPLEPGKPGSIDRAGCVNLLTPSRMISKNVAGMAPNSCLVEISKWEV